MVRTLLLPPALAPLLPPPAATCCPNLRRRGCAGMNMGLGSLWLTICDVVGSAIYFLDLWMGFQLGIIARWEGRAVIVQSELHLLHFDHGFHFITCCCWLVGDRCCNACGVAVPAGPAGAGVAASSDSRPARPTARPPTYCLEPADWAVSAWFYMRCGTFWTDMLACLPIFAQIVVASTGTTAQVLRLIAMLRLLRLIRWAGHLPLTH